MTDTQQPTWVLPAEIPFAKLKARDLEECVYWLLDAMGARDLEWRTGSSGAGAADGGRDLEASFYQPSPDGEMESQRWWIECKGRSSTLESEAVRNAVVNTQAKHGLASLVIVTNSTFSNPTRDWVREWQSTHPLPKIKLWDRTSLERLLSQQPSVVLRLFSGALSTSGRLEAARERFWKKLEYVPFKTLKEFWAARKALIFGPLDRIALIANELAHGSLVERPWAANADPLELFETLQILLINMPYLVLRSANAGVDQGPITATAAHLVMMSLRAFPADTIAEVVRLSISSDEGDELPDSVVEMLLGPILDQISSELQDVCTTDCDRFHATDRQALHRGADPVKTYWQRFDKRGTPAGEEQTRWARIENTTKACRVGFPTDKKRSCPLFEIDPQVNNMAEFFEMVKRITTYRTS